MITVILPTPLSELARVEREIGVDLQTGSSFASLIDAIEVQYPALRGTIREISTKKRRPMIRIFACEEDYSHLPLDTDLPAEVLAGKQPVIIVGAIAGG